MTLTLYKLYGNEFSLSRPRQAAGASSLPEGAFSLCAPKAHLLFLTSTAFVDTKAKPRAEAGQEFSLQAILQFLFADRLCTHKQ